MNWRQAHRANLLATSHDPITDDIPAYDQALPRGPYQVDSPFEAPPQTPKASPASWRPSRVRLLVGALVLGLTLGAVEEAARLSGYAPDMQHLARLAGFGIDQVNLKGHTFSFDRDIFDALDLANVKTFAALDTAAVKARIERLPWIDTAELSRVYPSRLDIRVTERTPFALWTRADRHYLIDKTGRVLAAVSGETLPKLPHFVGEGAAAEAAPFIAQLARYPEISASLAIAERVSERRWRLKLSNDTIIELPADGEIGALEAIAGDEALKRLIVAGRTTLDFRGPGRLAIRPETPAASGPAPGTGS
jgi:cell division protein FtsQ